MTKLLFINLIVALFFYSTSRIKRFKKWCNRYEYLIIFSWFSIVILYAYSQGLTDAAEGYLMAIGLIALGLLIRNKNQLFGLIRSKTKKEKKVS